MTEKRETRHNVRIHTAVGTADLEALMTRVGVEWPGVVRMLPKAVSHVVEIRAVRTPAALILKEEMLSKGGDAAIHRDCITGRADLSDVVLMGSEKVIRQVTESLSAQPFSLKEIAREIGDATENFRRVTPLMPPEDLLTGAVGRLYRTMSQRTVVMGILNVTPDSFSDGGRYTANDAAVEHGLSMADDGADILDVGGESSRLGSEAVSADEEMSRVLPVIERLASEADALISVDTCKPEVARAALDSGAHIINDITGLRDSAMIRLVAESKCPTVVMHMKGTPGTMQNDAFYEDVVSEVMGHLRDRIMAAVEAGVPREILIVDPGIGIGFAKTGSHNLEILRKLGDFKSIGLPILVGTSRKRFIGDVLNCLPVGERMEGTAATVALSIAGGANIVRVHDVREMVRVARMSDAIVRLPVARSVDTPHSP
ncbi:MAG: dihydropteroate synthase [Armatimonadetes bacterium]|nr:dihydropteroate synthase [Armatimonadota bacterium]